MCGVPGQTVSIEMFNIEAMQSKRVQTNVFSEATDNEAVSISSVLVIIPINTDRIYD